MREETEFQFRRLLEDHDRDLLRLPTADAHQALRDQTWDTRFHDRIEHLVHPIMTRLRAMMHEHGLRSEIVVTHRQTNDAGRIVPSSIAFEFHVLTDPETHGFPVTTPSVTFVGDPTLDAVQVHENSMLPFLGGHVGMIDQCKLAWLDEAFVEKHLLAVARKILRGTDAQ